MSSLENMLFSRKPDADGEQQQESTAKLSSQAFNLATTAAVGLATAALLVESKGRALPALAEIGDSALTGVLRRSQTVAEDVIGFGSRILSKDAKPAMNFIAEDVTAGAKGSLLEASPNSVLADKELLARAKAPPGDMELGARPAPQYGNGTRPIETKYLNFIDKWPVEGVRVHGDKVDIYVTKNHHWLELKDFNKPAGFKPPFSQSTVEVNGLDILNTRISNIRVPSLNSALNGSENQAAALTLSRGGAPEIKLSGNIKATEFWH